MLLAALLFATRPQTAHWSLILDFGTKTHFAEMTEAESVDGLIGEIQARIAKGLDKQNVELEVFVAKKMTAHADDVATWQTATSGQTSDRFVLICLDKWKQKNRAPEEILAAPNKAASETTVELRLWTYDPKTNALTVPGRKDLVGTANGGYFGSTDRTDMSGVPDAKTLEIRNINRKRAQAIANATWEAVQAQLLAN